LTLTDDPPVQPSDERAADLVLARIHLRLGSFGLARAELEAMAGRNALDDEGIRDLAEVRWRTGDLPGAGDAAVAYLEDRPNDVLSLVISAEVQAHLGRPGEARRLAGRAISRSTGSLDRIFAGMPRSQVWPSDPGSTLEPAETLFTDLGPAWHEGLPVEAITPVLDLNGDAATVQPPEPDPHGPGLWDAQDDTKAAMLPDPGILLARARAALEADRPGQAAAGLALAIRAEPSLAPAVLDLIAGRTEPVLALVRGDAHRIVGHEAEAMRDYIAAVAAIGLERRSDERARDERDDAPGTDEDPADRTEPPAEPPTDLSTDRKENP
jgi:hypothetical protein